LTSIILLSIFSTLYWYPFPSTLAHKTLYLDKKWKNLFRLFF
jgi:hypothetical protein